MSNKQSSIEWLYNNLKSHFEYDGDLLEAIQFSFKQAKEMHKQEIIDAYKFGISDEFVIGSENYYNETFVAQK